MSLSKFVVFYHNRDHWETTPVWSTREFKHHEAAIPFFLKLALTGGIVSDGKLLAWQGYEGDEKYLKSFDSKLDLSDAKHVNICRAGTHDLHKEQEWLPNKVWKI